jgi:hypothetical protein
MPSEEHASDKSVYEHRIVSKVHVAESNAPRFESVNR